jgi:hypothetical protein
MLSLPQGKLHSPRLCQPKCRFSSSDDSILRRIVENAGTENWERVASLMDNKTPRQCKERWTNYIDPRLSRDNWTTEDNALLYTKVADLGTKWKAIAVFFPGRSKNFLKTKYFAMRKAMKGIGPFKERTGAPTPPEEQWSFQLVESFRFETGSGSTFFGMDDDSF